MLRPTCLLLRKLVSIGGWCGPALNLGKLGLRTEAYPFDFSRVTLDGVAHFIRNGFDEGFFPPGPPPFRPECVGIWVLFRGVHTAFAHFDLNDPKIIDGFRRKMQRWDETLRDPQGEGVTFFRTVTAKDPMDEIHRISDLECALRERNPALDYRIALVVHDQGLLPTTTQLAQVSGRCRIWALEYSEGPSKTLFDRSQRGYADITAQALDDSVWSTSLDVADLMSSSSSASSPWISGDRGIARAVDSAKRLDILSGGESGGSVDTSVEFVPWELLHPLRFPWRSHNNLALIDGVASVGGTCAGVGSTAYCIKGACSYCNRSDMHKAGKPFRTNRPFTDEEDEVLLIHLYKILTGGDKIEAVEQLAHEMNRGAFEIICRIQYLTDSSTKLTEGLEPEEGV